MPTFSQRRGLKPAEQAFQRESVDEALRTRLWNAISSQVWEKFNSNYPDKMPGNDRICAVALDLLVGHLNFDRDRIPRFLGPGGARERLKAYFFDCEWNEVYDFLEALCQNEQIKGLSNRIEDVLNQALQTHNAAYRIIDSLVVEITDEIEIAAIDDALANADMATRTHIATALKMLSDRDNPDYRNSVKESISAVEAACRRVTDNPKATLADALKKIKGIHPAFNKSMALLYGYAGDESGIRHALSGEAQITYADAKYMMVACSAFVSYLLQSASDDE